jgi:two-component system response regulator YesN
MVEDEPIEMKAMDIMVRSLGLDIGPLWQVESGYKALEVARAHQPDVLLMDVNIPGVDGLEVISRLRSEGYSGVAIVLTAYNRFEYAKLAIQAQVLDYLLKPIDAGELLACLERAFESLRSASERQSKITVLRGQVDALRAQIRSSPVQPMLDSDFPEEMMRSLYGWPKDKQLRAYMICLSFGVKLAAEQRDTLMMHAQEMLDPMFSLADFEENGSLFIVLHARKNEDQGMLDAAVWCASSNLIKAAQELSLPCVPFVSSQFSTYSGFRKIRGQCMPPQRSLSPELWLPGAITARLPMSARELRIRQAKAFLHIRAGNPAKAATPFRALLSNPKTYWQGVYCVLDMFREHRHDVDLFDAFSRLRLSKGASPGRWIEELIMEPAAPPPTGDENIAVRLALDIIEHSYMDPFLSQITVAEQLGLSQAYFSRLFKLETGTTFISKLTHTRLEHAKHQLLQGLQTAQVASDCGYQSVKYFGAAFRQHFGKSVMQFRKETSPHTDDRE